ncbi:tetratricopeptide repeat protein [Pelagicoccus sp. SDUM812003]|uniref:tetratricopeptide repeat protein n=1 Tax=Pelagicoccus sp. SDUM812003 TaxID=3041267 RepID=UPI0028101F86|nr:tetratricopeptide repeat protein [Pelagicoccus sp. SDUM812003]MDQ8205275.1 tetratricopeptide repeat protein [Pelagicoccus sp. SDUM812003]
MLARFTTAALLAIFCLDCSLRADAFLGVRRAEIEQVIDLGYNLDPAVEEAIEGLKAKYPESPVPGLLEVGRLYWKQNYLEWDTESKERFESVSSRALKQAVDFSKEHPEDSDAQFVVAMIELSQVIYYVDHHRWWAAFWKSRGSLKTMRQLLEKSPRYADAKLPLGMANCYLSKTPGYLKPLAFLMRFKGDWDTGIRFMQDLKQEGLFCRVDAGYYLGGIQIELVGDREAARDEFAELARRYPGNLKFRSMWAELERGLGNAQRAWDLAGEVVADGRISDFPAIRLRTLETRVWSSLALGEYDNTLAAIETIEEVAAGFEFLAPRLAWATHARAEALLGRGEAKEALELWASIDSTYPGVHEAAQRRAAEVKKSLAGK